MLYVVFVNQPRKIEEKFEAIDSMMDDLLADSEDEETPIVRAAVAVRPSRVTFVYRRAGAFWQALLMCLCGALVYHCFINKARTDCDTMMGSSRRSARSIRSNVR